MIDYLALGVIVIVGLAMLLFGLGAIPRQR